jgi:hypothetical protein
LLRGSFTDNNFKKDSWTRILASFNGMLTELGDVPMTKGQLQSQLSTRKREFTEFSTVKNFSGFGWNEDEQMVVAADQCWRALAAAHPNKQYETWKTKPFLHWDLWDQVFSGRVATGRHGTSSADTVPAAATSAVAADAAAGSREDSSSEGSSDEYVDGDRDTEGMNVSSDSSFTSSSATSADARASREAVAAAARSKAKDKRTRTTKTTQFVDVMNSVLAVMDRQGAAGSSSAVARALALYRAEYAAGHTVQQRVSIMSHLGKNAGNIADVFLACGGEERDMLLTNFTLANFK